ncbi:MAG TPA: amidase [Vicinamibacteria bacterium]|nr:amidase [Vicinamibacteria bacterium]
MSPSPLCFLPARELARLVRVKEVSAVELLQAHLDQIERVNPKVNAIVTLVPELARERARLLDERAMRGESLGPLHGIPLAVKDLERTRGIRTTFGSRIYENHVPERSALFVERLEAAGAVVLGKTNTPEFGAGSQTFNSVFGRTRNPYDPTRTCGGSSGGAAVALACGMVPLADGSDLGGSLRNPAAFCNVVGLRPSPGRVPRYPVVDPWNSLNVLGPMARTVADVGLLLSVMAGPDPRDPIALAERGEVFRESLEQDFRGTRIAWSPDLDGFPVAREIVEALEDSLPVFSELGCEVERASPDLRWAPEIFQTLRAHGFALAHAHELEEHRALMKDTVIWNIEKGLALTASELMRAERGRAALFHRMREFMETYEFLLLPVTQVLPFPIEVEWVREIEGVTMETYIDWMKSCYFISLTAQPALSVPAGFSEAGLPVGLQIVGRHRRELDVLRLAHAFEEATRFNERRPPLAL